MTLKLSIGAIAKGFDMDMSGSFVYRSSFLAYFAIVAATTECS